MKIGRRRLLRKTAVAGSFTVLTEPLLALLMMPSQEELKSARPTELFLPQEPRGDQPMFKIAGWDRDDLAAFGGPIAPVGAKPDSLSEQYSISIDRSWRATWR